MRVHVDPARGDQRPLRVDLAARGARGTAGLDDALAVDREVAGEARRTGAVDDGAAADDEVVHGGLLAAQWICAHRQKEGRGRFRDRARRSRW